MADLEDDGDDDVLQHRLLALCIVMFQGGHTSSRIMLSQQESLVHYDVVLQQCMRFRDGCGRLPLHSALWWNCSVDVIHHLLACWPESIKVTTTSSRKLPLHYVPFDRGEHSLRLVELLVQAWPDAVRQPDGRGWFPLHYACCYYGGSTKVIRFLLQCWPESIRIRTIYDEELPLHLACKRKNHLSLTIIQLLVQSWPDAVQEIDEGGRLPLHRACHCQASYPVIQYLVECWPASLQVCDEYDRMPLHWACKFHSSATVIRYLVNAYPPAVQVRDASSYFPLHYACCCRRKHNNKLLSLEIIEHLVQLWPDSVRTKGGEQDHLPLHAALSDEHGPYYNGNDQPFVEMIQFLVHCWPASLQIGTRDEGQLPLHLACMHQSPAVILLVLNSYPQAVQIPDGNGKLPLHHACARRRTKDALPITIMEHLVQAWPESCLVACPDTYEYEDGRL